jgi:uncharacterized membrane protein YqiK
MTGSQFGSFILALVVVAIVVAIGVWLLHWLYLRSSKERAFVRTGLGGQKVVLNGGAFVLPIVHDVLPVNMNTLRLEVSRGRDKALITKDRMRVDVTAEFYVRVQATVDAIANAAQTLGQRTHAAGCAQGAARGQVRRRAAHRRGGDDDGRAAREARRIREARARRVAGDLLNNGLELESASLTQLDQTSMEFFNPSNAFDAEGLTRLTEQIERRKKQRNDIEQDTLIQIRNKNLEAEKMSLDIDRDPRARASPRSASSRSRARSSARSSRASAPSTSSRPRGPRSPRASRSSARASPPSARSRRTASPRSARSRRARSSARSTSRSPSSSAPSPSPGSRARRARRRPRPTWRAPCRSPPRRRSSPRARPRSRSAAGRSS